MSDKSYLYAYGDEAGDLGFAFEQGSSRYFAIALILTNRPEYISQQIKRLRATLGLSARSEFKFHKMSNNFRSKFLTTVAKLPFTAHVLIADKAQLGKKWQQADTPTLYALFLAELIKQIPDHCLGGTILTLDQFGSLTITRLAVRRELKRFRQRPFKRIKFKRSQGNDLIQCADMIVGAMMRYQQHNDDRFSHLVDNKITVWHLPEK